MKYLIANSVFKIILEYADFVINLIFIKGLLDLSNK